MDESADLTQLLLQWREGDGEAFDELVSILYDQLQEVARGRLQGERLGHTMGTTALVHEAYIRLIALDRIDWQDRSHFLAVASTTMRRILVDYARQRRAQKRGGSAESVSFQEELIPDERVDVVLELDNALEQLGAVHERQGKALELYYFGGLTLKEVGATLGVSTATAMRDVRFSTAWLAREWGETSDVE